MFGVLVVVLCPDRIAVLGFGAGEHTVEPLARRTLRSSIRKTDAALGGATRPNAKFLCNGSGNNGPRNEHTFCSQWFSRRGLTDYTRYR
jgi:hypothetical protein